MTTKLSVDSVRDYLKEIGRIPLLTPNEEIELGRKIKKWQDLETLKQEIEQETETSLTQGEWSQKAGMTVKQLDKALKAGKWARQKMVKANLRLVVTVAKKYMNRGLEFQDLIQEGSIGLTRSVEKFDYSKGYKFSTYAYWWIRQGITRAIAEKSRTVRLPIHVGEKLNKVKKAYRILTIEHGRKPTTEEVGAYLEMTPASIEELFKVSRKTYSLDQTVGDEKESTIGDFIEDPSNNGAVAMEALFHNHEVEKYLGLLNEKQRKVMWMRYMDNHSLATVGRLMDLSRERVRQIEAKALTVIRGAMKVTVAKT
ncbi:MAG: sigma-70 family RNA polymerase sigma factor [Microcystaceae cyanobacterium]